jgi:DNA-binding transcriptional MerR regulator
MPVSFGEWLKYVARAERVDRDALVRRTGFSAQRIVALMDSAGQPPSTEEIAKIAQALDINKTNMERSLRAMQTYDSIKGMKQECNNACCPWNAPID